MREWDKYDILTYIALTVSAICLVFTGALQIKAKNSIPVSYYQPSDLNTSQTYDAQYSYSQTELQTSIETQTMTEAQTQIISGYETEAFTQDNYYTYPNTTQINNVTTTRRTVNIDGIIPWTRQSTKPNTTKTQGQAPQVLDTVFVYSKNSNKLHSRSCPYALKIKEENLCVIDAEQLDEYLEKGYVFCSYCQGYVIEG